MSDQQPPVSILAFDIGGTKTASAVASFHLGRIQSLTHEHHWPSRSVHDFLAVAKNWVSEVKDSAKPLAAVGIGVAGPVGGVFPTQTAYATNLGWSLNARELQEIFKTPVFICNDMESHGWGILGLAPEKTHTLHAAPQKPGCMALIAAGTGLGESIIAWDGTRHIPLGGEGGHAAFSPFDDRDDRLLAFLRGKIGGHVSWERALGGFDGFRNLALFLNHEGEPLPKTLTGLSKERDDWGAAIIQLAQSGDLFCDQLLSYYATLYGREAANLAVKCMPYSGVYVGGGIAPRILPWLERHFARAFVDKGRFERHLREIPVFVILDPANGLKGAAIGAWHLLARGQR